MGQPPEVSHSEMAEPAMRGGVTLGADFSDGYLQRNGASSKVRNKR